MAHKTARKPTTRQVLTIIPDLSRTTLDVLLGDIFAPVVNGKRELPQLAPVDSPLPSKLESQMRKWEKGRACAVCGGTLKVQAHHLWPRHIWPQLMWMPEFWFPLCRGNKEIDCHCIIGHGGNFKGFNPYCVAMAELLRPIFAANKLLLAQIRATAKPTKRRGG